MLSVQFIDVGTMVSPTVYARRSLCHLMCDQPDAALRDAMQAQCVYPDWSTAFYMQAVALAKLDMHKDAADMLKEAASLEEKRQRSGRGSWEAVIFFCSLCSVNCCGGCKKAFGLYVIWN